MRKYKLIFCLTALAILLIPQFIAAITPLVASTKPEEKLVGREYPVEVVSIREIESLSASDEVSTLYEYTVRISRKTIIKMIKEDWETYEYIALVQGKSAAKEWRKQEIEKAMNGPDYIELTITMVQFGEKSITYYNGLYQSPTGSPTDPVNLDFVGQGSAGTVLNHMVNNLDNHWAYPAWGISLYAFIDERPHGGSLRVESQWAQLDYPPGEFLYERNHARIFAGGYDPHGFGYWSIGGAHFERWHYLYHIIVSWDDAEALIRDDFLDEPFCSRFEHVEGYNKHINQGVPHDGKISRLWLD